MSKRTVLSRPAWSWRMMDCKLTARGSRIEDRGSRRRGPSFRFAMLRLLFSVLCFATHSDAADNPGQYVLVVANRTVPDSLKVAKYYAEKRGVPKEQICVL